MPTPEAETILADVESAWAPLQAEVHALGEARLDEPTVAGWTAKELLSHVAFWAEAVEGFVTSAWRNRPLPEGWAFGSGYVPASDGSWPHYQVHNDREAAWARGRTPREVLGRLSASHERLTRFLATVTAEEAARDSQYWSDVAGHLREHTDELRGVEQEKLTRESLLARVDEHWQPFRAAVEEMGPAGLQRETRAGWTVKEMVATVAFWDEAAVGAIIGMMRRQPMPPGWGFGSGYVPQTGAEWPRADVHNAREAAWARDRSADVVLARLDAAHAELVKVLETVTEEELVRDGDYYSRLGQHYREHLGELQGARRPGRILVEPGTFPPLHPGFGEGQRP
jgi:hypothetical protein